MEGDRVRPYFIETNLINLTPEVKNIFSGTIDIVQNNLNCEVIFQISN